MPEVRPGAAARWARRSANASQDYTDGVNSTPNDWEKNTLAAHESYKSAVVKAANEGRQAAGVRRSGQSWWKKRTTEVGPQRFAEGVAASQSTYEEGVAPYLAAIAGTKLSPRGPKGDPRNYKRVMEMGEALRRVKTGGKS